MTISSEQPLFLTIPAAARRMGIDPRRLKAAIGAKQIPAAKVGRQRLVPLAAIERLAMVKHDA